MIAKFDGCFDVRDIELRGVVVPLFMAVSEQDCSISKFIIVTAKQWHRDCRWHLHPLSKLSTEYCIDSWYQVKGLRWFESNVSFKLLVNVLVLRNRKCFFCREVSSVVSIKREFGSFSRVKALCEHHAGVEELCSVLKR